MTGNLEVEDANDVVSADQETEVEATAESKRGRREPVETELWKLRSRQVSGKFY